MAGPWAFQRELRKCPAGDTSHTRSRNMCEVPLKVELPFRPKHQRFSWSLCCATLSHHSRFTRPIRHVDSKFVAPLQAVFRGQCATRWRWRFVIKSRSARGKTPTELCVPRLSRRIRSKRKSACKTETCEENSKPSACYLCNTVPKTIRRARSGAVPLLLVQSRSVIVMVRRRGASRGRPVLGGSLKSLAFMRECPKARSG